MRSLRRWVLRWFCPDMQVPHICQVPLEQLRAQGIRVLFVDLDNTLIEWGSGRLGDGVAEWLARAKQMGFQVVIVSNAGRQKRVARIANELGIVGFAGAWKPRRFVFRRYLALTGVAPAHAAMIGDQLLTDIWGAKRAGIFAILVEPLTPRRFITGRLQRPLERLLLRLIQRWHCPDGATRNGQ